MVYKLINKKICDIENPQYTIFKNRGIDNIKEYKNLTDNCLIHYHNLENIDVAVECFLKHINSNNKIGILVDCDADGYCSSAILYRYIFDICPFAEVTYFIHTGKQHGLSNDIKIPTDIQLLIIPDAGSNDVEQCKELSELGIDILILDHHECDRENPYAIVVNNQMSKNYANKNLCGVGIVYKFLQAIDEETWNSFADNYLDLVALGNISDCMDIKSYETKKLIDKGLNKIINKFFKQIIEAQAYSIGNDFNIHSVSFYITPLINAMCRCGDYDDKDLMFRAFIETDEVFKYKKRGETDEIDETIYSRATRLCKNTKAKQDKLIQKAMPNIKKRIESKSQNDNPIMFVNITDDIPNTLTGVMAMKLADFYNRPCLLLRKNSIKDGYYGGSGRNFDTCPLSNIKDFLNDLGQFEYVQGHQGAFGISIKAENVKDTIEICKEKLKEIDFEEIGVDFEINYEDFSIAFIREIDNLKNFYGTGFKEPFISVKNIPVEINQCMIMGKESTTWKIITDEGIAFIRFKNYESDEMLNWIQSKETDKVIMDVVGKVGFNCYNGILNPQLEVKDYKIKR